MSGQKIERDFYVQIDLCSCDFPLNRLAKLYITTLEVDVNIDENGR